MPSTSDQTSRGDYGALRRLYADYAPRYDRQFARYTATTLRRAIAALGDQPPGRLVDVACGTGVLAEQVRERWPGTPIVGVDLSPEMLAQAARRMPRTGTASTDGAVPTDWRAGPAEKLPVGDGEADTLTCTNAFHLVQAPDDALAEFRRVLRPGGRLVLVDWSRDFLSMRGLLLALRVVRRQRRRPWTLESLRAAVELAGFSIEATDRFKSGPVWGLMTIVGRRR
ncbi:MAG: methyltransferase domain-containing protein [Phycisphaerales bacterium]